MFFLCFTAHAQRVLSTALAALTQWHLLTNPGEAGAVASVYATKVRGSRLTSSAASGTPQWRHFAHPRALVLAGEHLDEARIGPSLSPLWRLMAVPLPSSQQGARALAGVHALMACIR